MRATISSQIQGLEREKEKYTEIKIKMDKLQREKDELERKVQKLESEKTKSITGRDGHSRDDYKFISNPVLYSGHGKCYAFITYTHIDSLSGI